MANTTLRRTGVSWLFYISLVTVVRSGLYDGRQLCSQCNDRDNSTDCNTYVWCASNQKCLTSSYITTDGRTKYFTGCVGKQACDDLEQHGTVIPLTGLLPVPSSIFDQSCCDGQGCNGIRDSPTGQPMCMTCPEIEDPSQCNRANLCSEHQECLYHKHLHFDAQYHVIYKYELKCEDKNSCPAKNGSCHPSPRSPGCTGDHGCCTGDFCNLFHAMYMKNLTSTQLDAGNIQYQTAGTGGALSTQCYLGADTGQVQVCTGATPYCLTNLTNYHNGYRHVIKSCVSEADCYQLSNRVMSSHCDLYNPDILYQRDFSCSYCCNKDLCNGQIVPPLETMYIPSIGSSHIVVREEPSDVDVNDCRDVMSVDQCLVFPCDNEHLARIYCRNHCKLC